METVSISAERRLSSPQIFPIAGSSEIVNRSAAAFRLVNPSILRYQIHLGPMPNYSESSSFLRSFAARPAALAALLALAACSPKPSPPPLEPSAPKATPAMPPPATPTPMPSTPPPATPAPPPATPLPAATPTPSVQARRLPPIPDGPIDLSDPDSSKPQGGRNTQQHFQDSRTN